MKIITIVGARPQFIKAASVSRAIQEQGGIDEIIVHTGQHFDHAMNDIFFTEMSIPQPKYNLGIHGKQHGEMTGEMMKGIEQILLTEKPDVVLVYGDTNSTLAGALAAAKLHIPIAHVEAGLRSFNLKMPEEVNRILTDRISTYLFCPTENAVSNLEQEGFRGLVAQNGNKIAISIVGDVMYDAVLFYQGEAEKQSALLAKHDLQLGEYLLCTLHRAENTDVPERISSIFEALGEIAKEKRIIIPLHPRTLNVINKMGIKVPDNVSILAPLGYFDMLFLVSKSKLVLTDSGGLQKEAYFLGKICLTLRDETEWTELVSNHFNFLVGADKTRIISTYHAVKENTVDVSTRLYGDGNAAKKIVTALQGN